MQVACRITVRDTSELLAGNNGGGLAGNYTRGTVSKINETELGSNASIRQLSRKATLHGSDGVTQYYNVCDAVMVQL